jgi:hypothetical protein
MDLKKIQQIGGISLVIGAVCLTVYSIMFFLVLPFKQIQTDMSQVVIHKFWITNTLIVFCGLILLMFGYLAAYSKMYSETKTTGFISIVIIEIAYLLQVCKVTWEIFIYPMLIRYDQTLFLLKDSVLKNDPAIGVYRLISSLAILAGVILFSFALYKSNVYSKLSAVFIALGAIMYGVGPLAGIFVAIPGIVIFAAGCFLLSLKLLKS